MFKKFLLLSTVLSTVAFAGETSLNIGLMGQKGANTDFVPLIYTSAEYSKMVYNIKSFGISVAAGVESNIGKQTDWLPAYAGVYINPTLDYLYNQDTTFKFGLKLGLGNRMRIYTTNYNKETDNGTVAEKPKNVDQTVSVPIEFTAGVNIRKLAVKTNIGTRVFYAGPNQSPKIKAIFSTGIQIGYIIK